MPRGRAAQAGPERCGARHRRRWAFRRRPNELHRAVSATPPMENLGSVSSAGASAGLSLVTQVDVGGIVRHGNAVGSTAMHVSHFMAMAEGYANLTSVRNWLNVILFMKKMKTVPRGGWFAGSCIPVPLVGALSGLLSTVVLSGTLLTMTKTCLSTAAELHWRAGRELFLAENLIKANGYARFCIEQQE